MMKISLGKKMMTVLVMMSLLLLLVGEVRVIKALSCNPSELSPCAPAFSSAASPSGACCSKLKQQQPCLCGYLKNPSLKPYINSPNAKKVSTVCKVPFPTKC